MENEELRGMLERERVRREEGESSVAGSERREGEVSSGVD